MQPKESTHVARSRAGQIARFEDRGLKTREAHAAKDRRQEITDWVRKDDQELDGTEIESD